MPVESIDYSSEEEYQQALQMEEHENRVFAELEEAEREAAEEQHRLDSKMKSVEIEDDDHWDDKKEKKYIEEAQENEIPF